MDADVFKERIASIFAVEVKVISVLVTVEHQIPDSKCNTLITLISRQKFNTKSCGHSVSAVNPRETSSPV